MKSTKREHITKLAGKNTKKARTLAKEKNSFYWCFIDRKKFPHDPRNSIIKSNIKLVRRLLLKVEKEVK